MTLNPNATLAATQASWLSLIIAEEQALDAMELEIAEQEAAVSALENAVPTPGTGLQAPIPNPVTARTIGPAPISDTGWQDMGGVDHTITFGPADPTATGAFSENGEFYLGCDTSDGNPTIGVKFTGIGSGQYPKAFYRKDGAWVSFQFNRGDGNYGRSLVLEDRVLYGIDKGGKTFSVRFNGALQVNSQGATSTITESFFAPAFPNGPGRYARYVRTSGTGQQAITLAGGVVEPITLRKATLDGDGHAIFEFGYTGEGPGYLSRRYDTSNNPTSDYAPAILVANPAKGDATYRSAQGRAPLAGSAVYELIEAQDATTPKPGAKPIRVTLVYPQPLQIGQNLALGDALPAQVNLASMYGALVIGAIQDANNGYKGIERGSALMDSRGAITNAPAGTSFLQAISGPDFAFSGQMHEMSWTEPGNNTSTSKWSHRVYGERSGADTIRFGTLSAISFANGRFYRRFTYFQTSRTDGIFDCGRVQWYGEGNVDDIRVAEVGADFSVLGGWRPTYIEAVLRDLPGFLRTMDVQNANTNKNDTGDFSTRVQPTENPYGRTNLRGMPFEKIIALNILTGRPIYAIIQPNWSESMVKGFVRGFFTGEGMQGGIKARDDATLYLDVTGNEPFNTAASIQWVYYYLVGIGQAAGVSNQNNARLYGQVQISNQNKQRINEAASEFRSRIVTIDCGSPSNHPYEWGVMTGYGLVKPDAWTSSIYWGVGVKGTSIGNNTPAEVAASWDGDVDRQVDAYFLNAETYKKAGVRRICYEIGSDNFFAGSAMNRDQRVAWAASPQYAYSFERMWTRFRSEGGDGAGLYFDIGDTAEWAHKSPVPGTLNPKWDIVKKVQAAADAAR